LPSNSAEEASFLGFDVVVDARFPYSVGILLVVLGLFIKIIAGVEIFTDCFFVTFDRAKPIWQPHEATVRV
jgi:hypothetical protein